MDYKEKIEKLKNEADSAEKLFNFRNNINRAIQLFREESKVTVYIENNGYSVKGYPSNSSESCPVFGEYREGVIEALKAQLEAVDKKLEEKFKEA